ncbi:D-alanine--D-alanine ligase [Enterobacteriaceae endosymbiont of Plateumaris consimilis]|uniref:D-alanine--D-alanine ligase n=1 Tax=Enterobacteriaceae endosymbiont of Plateumaris consimilis TaxID=2675794 RepID=UPI00144902E7|nr:D-alanine--D-alanine ligase [Enterobacteriaceae endosymbiont of Plateumaris consimilis]QJC28557.1 D-alanine--D-alanine ligase [Enterobacteriaceae endosymbiont of Plateumaris consimilis]
MFNKIAVLYGGNSPERKISLISGHTILNTLQKMGIEAYGLDTRDFPLFLLKKNKFKKIFIALHGEGGEDGSLQTILEYLKIPYTGSRSLASTITMNKFITKTLWKEYGLPVYPHFFLKKIDFIKKNYLKIKKTISKLNFPVCVKPNSTGSSLGISKVNNIHDLLDAIKKALIYSNDILIEKYIDGVEYTVSILGNKTLPSIKIKSLYPFYNYKAKYIDKNTKYFCPSGLNKYKEKELSELAMKAWNVLECSGWGRVDIILDKNNNFQLLEINTCPGMTPNSLFPMAAKKSGLSFYDVINKILFLAK